MNKFQKNPDDMNLLERLACPTESVSTSSLYLLISTPIFFNPFWIEVGSRPNSFILSKKLTN